MARNATEAQIDDLRDALDPFVQDITHDTAAVQTLYRADAQAKLGIYLDAYFAHMNVSASAATNYSTSLGKSVTKQDPNVTQANKDKAWGDFVTACALGGSIVPSIDQAASLWDLS